MNGVRLFILFLHFLWKARFFGEGFNLYCTHLEKWKEFTLVYFNSATKFSLLLLRSAWATSLSIMFFKWTVCLKIANDNTYIAKVGTRYVYEIRATLILFMPWYGKSSFSFFEKHSCSKDLREVVREAGADNGGLSGLGWGVWVRPDSSGEAFERLKQSHKILFVVEMAGWK